MLATSGVGTYTDCISFCDLFSGYSRSKEVRASAAHELRVYVELEARKMSSENFAKLMNEINKVILDLCNSSEVHEKHGGILVIGNPTV